MRVSWLLAVLGALTLVVSATVAVADDAPAAPDKPATAPEGDVAAGGAAGAESVAAPTWRQVVMEMMQATQLSDAVARHEQVTADPLPGLMAGCSAARDAIRAYRATPQPGLPEVRLLYMAMDTAAVGLAHHTAWLAHRGGYSAPYLGLGWPEGVKQLRSPTQDFLSSIPEGPARNVDPAPPVSAERLEEIAGGVWKCLCYDFDGIKVRYGLRADDGNWLALPQYTSSFRQAMLADATQLWTPLLPVFEGALTALLEGGYATTSTMDLTQPEVAAIDPRDRAANDPATRTAYMLSAVLSEAQLWLATWILDSNDPFLLFRDKVPIDPRFEFHREKVYKVAGDVTLHVSSCFQNINVDVSVLTFAAGPQPADPFAPAP